MSIPRARVLVADGGGSSVADSAVSATWVFGDDAVGRRPGVTGSPRATPVSADPSVAG